MRWDDANKDPSIVFDKNICRISDCRYFTNEMCCYKKKIPIVICQICGVRPKCEKQDLCKICFEWREGRVEDWGEQINTGKEATIWLDEISDISNRVAVIVGKFDLSRWLNGEYLKTIFSQWLEDWYYQKNKDKRDIRDKLSEDLRILNYNLKYTEKEKYELVKELLLLIASNFRRCTSKKKMECYVRIFNTFVDYNIKTSSNDTAQTLREKLEKAFIGRRVIENQGEKIDIEFATLKLFKKHPSPARLRRIWSTTYNFWDELIENILKEKSLYISDIEASNIKKERKDYLKEIRFKRVHLKAKGFDEPGLYKLKINGVESEWYWDGRELISINNLQLLFGSYKSKNLKELRKELSKAKIELSNKEDSKKEIKIEPLDSESSYLPFTEIFKSPVSFIIIVPATSAVDIIKKIKEKYEDEFGKVRNRLPLHIGVIYFHRKAPLYIALNSVRRFFKGITENEYRRICAVCDFDVNIAKRKPEKIKLTFDKGVTPTEIKVPILTGHIDVDDNYYPYFLINKADNIEKRPSYFVGFRKSHSTGNNSLLKVPLLHVSDLQKDDEIEFVPSYFDFEFLDTNT
ncbi:MAG: CRISPR-associated protein Csx11, partial [Methanosarcinales archaeon]